MTRKDLTEGALFEMADASAVLTIPGILDAKAYLIDKVMNHPTVNANNRTKVLGAITKCLTHYKLSKLVSDYILAHQSVSLKVIK